MARSSVLLCVLSVALVAALCCLSSGVEAKTDLCDFCSGLEQKMSRNNEPKVALREARKYMKTTFNLGSVSKLARAWEAVVKEEPCGKNSAKIVTTIAECNPKATGPLATLFAAAQRYSIKCLTPAFWDEQLDKKLGAADKSGLSNFLDEQFLAHYRKQDANVYFATNGGQNCCQPDGSLKTLLEAVGRIVGGGQEQARQLVQTHLRKEDRSLERTLEVHLFKPCERYTQTLDELMWAASRAANYYKPNERSFVGGLSQKFQDALFRFKYCDRFRYLNWTGDKMDKISWAKLSA